MKKNKKLLFSGIISLIIGFALLISIITREKIFSKNDLKEINAQLKNYSIIKSRNYLNQEYSVHIFLEQYSNDFIIQTDYTRYFQKSKFEQSLRPGDSIKVEVYNKDFKNLSNQRNVRIYGLSDKYRPYLHFNDTIRELNSPKYNFFAAAFIIIGVLALFRSAYE